MAAAVSLLLRRNIGRIPSRIGGILGEGSNQAASMAGQVSVSSQSLVQGASEQAFSLQEAGNLPDKLSEMVRHNAQSAEKLHALIVEIAGVRAGQSA